MHLQSTSAPPRGYSNNTHPQNDTPLSPGKQSIYNFQPSTRQPNNNNNNNGTMPASGYRYPSPSPNSSSSIQQPLSSPPPSSSSSSSSSSNRSSGPPGLVYNGNARNNHNNGNQRYENGSGRPPMGSRKTGSGNVTSWSAASKSMSSSSSSSSLSSAISPSLSSSRGPSSTPLSGRSKDGWGDSNDESVEGANGADSWESYTDPSINDDAADKDGSDADNGNGAGSNGVNGRAGDLEAELTHLTEGNDDGDLLLFAKKQQHQRRASEQDTTPKDEPTVNSVYVLYDPPVEGCEMKPYASITDVDNSIFSVDGASHVPVAWRWSASPRRLCANNGCGSSAKLQCLTCVKYRIDESLSYFCSSNCLSIAYPSHRHLHNCPSGLTPQVASALWAASQDDTDALVYGPNGPSEDPSLSSHQIASLVYGKFPIPPATIWREISKTRCYTPTADDVGRSLRIEVFPLVKPRPSSSSSSSPSSSSSNLVPGRVCRIETAPVLSVPPPPPARQLLAAPTPPSPSSSYSAPFRVVCYNVLAQMYASLQMYPYCAPWAITWEYRRMLLLREILSYGADIICLQEVQAEHFETFFQPQLARHGYDGIFKPKQRETNTWGDKPHGIDGCATLYRRDRFALNEQYGIEFNEAARMHFANDKRALRRLIRGNIALVLVLEELVSSTSASKKKRRLCVANTHIFWDPDFADVKLWQTWILCQELEKLVLSRHLPLLLCGDFNSTQDSAVYELLQGARVMHGQDVYGTGDPAHILPPNLSNITHRLALTSAYSQIGEPKYTNYTGHFIGVLDYILYAAGALQLVSALDVDHVDQLSEHTALPSPKYPSDHIALMCELAFKLDI